MARKQNRERENIELLLEIMAQRFAVLETVLYLNTHPRDENVLRLHNEFARRLQELEGKYQRLYGPLHAAYPEAEYPWQWYESPWPWEMDY